MADVLRAPTVRAATRSFSSGDIVAFPFPCASPIPEGGARAAALRPVSDPRSSASREARR